MCSGLEIAALAATVAGTATDAYAQHQALSKQDDIAAAGIMKQGQLQKQGESDVNSAVQTLNQSNAKVQQQSASQLAAYRTALQQSQNISQSADPNVPGASKAFKQEQQSATGGASSYVDALAKNAATTQGTQLERVGENQTMSDTASKLGLLTTQSNEQSYLTKLQIQATQANPWLESLGMVLKGAGMAMGAGAGFAAAGAGAGAGAAAGTGIGASGLSGTEGLATGATNAGGNVWGQASSSALQTT